MRKSEVKEVADEGEDRASQTGPPGVAPPLASSAVRLAVSGGPRLPAATAGGDGNG